MRLFISVPLPENVRKVLAKVKQDFPEIPAKWVEEENLHLTLVFLGEMEDSKAAKAAEAITTAANGLKLINLETDGLSLLPNEKEAHILAVKLTGEIEKLSALAKRIKEGLREGKIIFDEKPFRPHITLARFRQGSGGQARLREKVHTHNLPKIEFKARRIELTESKLTPTGPVYKPLKTINLS